MFPAFVFAGPFFGGGPAGSLASSSLSISLTCTVGPWFAGAFVGARGAGTGAPFLFKLVGAGGGAAPSSFSISLA